ncbi:MAG TPA: XRE family transcriptional regulator [Pseudomonas xinjiangensis]|uniref:XRE family transcriptional regulator n=2 Tax=root TaxID=1 RepID=A0A7V1BPZ8_9GAMM|nr:XRE family transcriptional regulator [Halopseudomonas xinjiangensis]HEC48483.1 XRE family transcriptional regulator [Halopseudomonas xinjiangensis]
MGVEELGQSIKQLRKERKLTQDELASQIGISRATLSGIENNTVLELGVRKYEKLLNALGHTLSVTAMPGRPTLNSLKKKNFDE